MIAKPEMSDVVNKVTAARPLGSGRTRLLLAAKIIVSLSLLVWILSRAGLPEIFAAIRTADPRLLLAAYSLDIVGLLISVSRWEVLLRAQGTAPRRSFLLKSSLVAVFFNNLLPSTVGGDASRAYDCYRQVGGRAMSSVLVDRLFGLLALVAFALFSLPFATQLASHVPLLALWLGGGVAGLLLVLWGIFAERSWSASQSLLAKLPARLGSALGLVRDAFQAYQGKWKTLVQAFALSVLLQANVVLYFVLVAWALNLGVPAFHFFLIVPLALFVMMLPISINGIGLRENTLAAMLAWYSVSTVDAVAFAWLAYLGNLLIGLLGGVVYALRR
jgi:glycosyltransferase 2 family protein